ncbi:HEAT repeat domain-containing protein [Streptosporangium sp. NPDC023615]|uniref:HEAT repeat domain-containing protein n=1 Tax=Streptosporangium sp. NPDC023615 TaxID=3154794 RepID=UPI00341D65DC
MTEEDIARLVELLDDDSDDIAEDAMQELMSIRPGVAGPLTAAVPHMRRYGQLCAIEIFQHLGDAGSAPVLIDLLDSEHETVREWSADALAQMGTEAAVPALQAAYRRLRATGTPPDFTEPVALRRALTVLGARRQVLPPLTASLQVSTGPDAIWPAARLEEVINDLAEHNQMVLYFSLWTVTDTGTYWTDHETLSREFDPHAPWPQAVAIAGETALLETAIIPARENLVAFVEWIDESDV